MTLKIFQKRSRKIVSDRCPYCGGELQTTSHYIWDYDCLKCDRAWRIFGNTWTALFDAGKMEVIK